MALASFKNNCVFISNMAQITDIRMLHMYSTIRIPLSCILETIKLFQIKAPAVYIFRMAQKLFTLFP